MTRARSRGSLDDTLRRILTRLTQVETRGRYVVTPVALTATVTVDQPAPVPVLVTLVNPTGSSVTFWVRVNLTSGTALHLQVREDQGSTSTTVDVTASGPSLASVTLQFPPDWSPGDLRLVYLDAWVDTNTATVLPLHAAVA